MRDQRNPVPPQAWEEAVGGVAAGLSKAGTQASNQITAQAATAGTSDQRLNICFT